MEGDEARERKGTRKYTKRGSAVIKVDNKSGRQAVMKYREVEACHPHNKNGLAHRHCACMSKGTPAYANKLLPGTLEKHC